MTYNVLREAQDVLELMDHLGLIQAAILGTSRGGLVAMTLAAMSKDRLSAVILNDIGPEIPPGGIARIMEYVGPPPGSQTSCAGRGNAGATLWLLLFRTCRRAALARRG